MPDEPKLSEELKKMETEYEPLLPVENKLITYSLVLGIILLAFFYWLSSSFFSGTH